jgi:outer membrane receptor protein involved in Fe transport
MIAGIFHTEDQITIVKNNLQSDVMEKCFEKVLSLRTKKINKMKNIKTMVMAVLLSAAGMSLQAQIAGEIRGRILDKTTNTALEAVSVAAYINNQLIAQDITNEKGYYSLKPLKPGEYTVKTYLMSFKPSNLEKVIVNTGNMTFANFLMESTEVMGPEITVNFYKVPLIATSGSGQIISTDEIENMPYTSPLDMAATSAGIVQSDNGESLNVRGSRSDGTQYIIDGMKVEAPFNLPKNAIKEIKVLTGGIPAMFGDATGGIIIITTKGFALW